MKPASHVFEIGYGPSFEVLDHSEAFPDGVPGTPSFSRLFPKFRDKFNADEIRQINAAVNWAATNHYKIILAGGRDAWMAAGLLGSNNVPVIYEHTFSQPARDTEPYDVHFSAPEVLRNAAR